MIGLEVYVGDIEFEASDHGLLEVSLVKHSDRDLGSFNLVNGLKIELKTVPNPLTTALGSKNKCSFQLHKPVPLISSLALVNFFSLRIQTSTRGSTVCPSGTFSCLAFSMNT